MTTIITLTAVALSVFILAKRTEKTRKKLEGKTFVFKVKVFVLAAAITIAVEAFVAYLLSLLFGFEFSVESILYVYTISLMSVYILEKATVWKKRRDIIRLVKELNSERSA